MAVVPARFVRCSFVCPKCNHGGNVKPWAREGETSIDAATRHTRETRSACIEGCAYNAWAVIGTKKEAK
jgi:hypothetical protein